MREENLRPVKRKYQKMQLRDVGVEVLEQTDGTRTQGPWGSWPGSFDFFLWNSREEQNHGERYIGIMK